MRKSTAVGITVTLTLLSCGAWGVITYFSVPLLNMPHSLHGYFAALLIGFVTVLKLAIIVVGAKALYNSTVEKLKKELPELSTWIPYWVRISIIAVFLLLMLGIWAVATYFIATTLFLDIDISDNALGVILSGIMFTAGATGIIILTVLAAITEGVAAIYNKLRYKTRFILLG